MSKLHIAKVTAAGQISIPKPLREQFCQSGDYITLEPYVDGLLLRRVKPFEEEGTTDEDNIKKFKPIPITIPSSESIDWEMEEAPPEPEAEEQGPSCPMDEPVDPPINESIDNGDADPEVTAKMRKEMWKALLDSRAY